MSQFINMIHAKKRMKPTDIGWFCIPPIKWFKSTRVRGRRTDGIMMPVRNKGAAEAASFNKNVRGYGYPQSEINNIILN